MELNPVARGFKELVVELELHKELFDNTYLRYTNYAEDSEEQRLSWEIMNAHFRHFQNSFISFLKYIKHDLATASTDIKSTNCMTTDTEESRISACHRLIQYDFHGSNSKSEATSVDELVSLVHAVAEVSKNLLTRYWDELVHISLAEPETPPGL
jgi:hypothetical protein